MFVGRPPWRDPRWQSQRWLDPRSFSYPLPADCPPAFRAVVAACLQVGRGGWVMGSLLGFGKTCAWQEDIDSKICGSS